MIEANLYTVTKNIERMSYIIEDSLILSFHKLQKRVLAAQLHINPENLKNNLRMHQLSTPLTHPGSIIILLNCH